MKKFYMIILTSALLLFVGKLQAQWHQTNGPEGGSVRCMISKGSDVYASVVDGGMYKSTDNGQNWVPINKGLNLEFVDITALAISGNNIVAGSWQLAGIYISFNNGQSWKAPANIGLTSTYVQALAVIGDTIFAGTYDSGVFISSNNGQSWSEINNGLTNKNIYSLVVSGSSIFAGTDQGVFRSTNNGQSWVHVNNGLTNSYIKTMAVNGTTVFAGIWGGGVFRSTNNGQSWQIVNSGLTSPGIFYLTSNDNKIYAGVYTMYSQNPDSTYKGGIFVSSNNGESWSNLDTNLSSDINYITISGKNIYAGTAGEGIFLSPDDGQNWTAINSGIINTDITAFVIDGNNFFAGTSGGGVFLSKDKGQNWTSMNSRLTNKDVSALAIYGKDIFAGTAGGGIFISSNSGKSWSPANAGLDNKWITSLAVNGNYLFIGTWNSQLNIGGLYVSTNNGQSWGKKDTGLINDNISSLAVMGNNIFAGTYGGGVFLSTNNGQSWSEVNTGLTDKNITSLAASGGNIFAGTQGGGIFRSNNNGQSWSEINTEIKGTEIKSITVSGDSIFAGTWFGSIVFLSTNNGQSWSEVDAGLRNTNGVGILAISGNNIFAGIFYGGVWKSPLSKLIKMPAPPIVGAITQPTCSIATGSVELSGLPSSAIYYWTINPGAIRGLTTNTTISGLSPGTYNFTVTTAGLTSDASADVVINAQPATPPAPTVDTITQPTCSVATGSVVLSGLPSGNWTINPGAISGSATSTTISDLTKGTYNYTVTNASGCTSNASADVVINAQPATPTAPIVSLLNDSTLHSDAPVGNQWYNQSGLIDSAINQDYTVAASGDYYVIVTINGCSSDTSNLITVVLTGVESFENNHTVKVYPNPVTKELIIEMKGNTKNIDFDILNTVGQVVFKGKLMEKTIVPTSSFAPGIYLIRFERGNNLEFKKIIRK